MAQQFFFSIFTLILRIWRSKWLFAAIVVIFLASRIIYLRADPPKDLSWSLGAFFDEGIYNHNARNYILFGQWKLDEWNDYYYSAISTWLKYAVFDMIGIGRAQIRLFSIAFSMFSLLLVYRATAESYARSTALLALLFFGTNYLSVMYSRLGMQDTQTLTVFILGFYFWQKALQHLNTRRALGYSALAGSVFFISYTFKNLFLYLLPTPFAALACYTLIHWYNPPLRKKLGLTFMALSGGMASAFLLWWITFYAPNRAYITQFGQFFTRQQMFPVISVAQFWHNLSTTPFFEYFSRTPVVLLGSLIVIGILIYGSGTRKRIQIPPADIFLFFWFFAAFVFIGIIGYRPPRYFLPIIPPMCILTARGVRELFTPYRRISIPKIHWMLLPVVMFWTALIIHRVLIPWGYRYLLKTPFNPFRFPQAQHLIASVVIAGIFTILLGSMAVRRASVQAYEKFFSKYPLFRLSIGVGVGLIGLSVYMDGKAYYQWAQNPQYAVHRTGQDLRQYLGEDGYIAGMDAPGVAFDTPYKTLISWDGYVNFVKNPIATYGLTHLFLGDTAGFPEKDRYFTNYPQEMQHATLLQRYEIKDTPFLLYSLVEPMLEDVQVDTPRERLNVRMRIRQWDFRQPRDISANWYLYPWNVAQDTLSLQTGEAAHRQAAPGKAIELTVSGNMPAASSGPYRLFAYWTPTITLNDEAEHMQRHIGQIVHDDAASGQRAAYWQGGASSTEGFLAFGNYREFRPGVYTARFRVKISDTTIETPVLRVDVVSDHGTVTLRQRDVLGTDLRQPREYQEITVPYILLRETAFVELRVYTYGTVDVWVDRVETTGQTGAWVSIPMNLPES